MVPEGYSGVSVWGSTPVIDRLRHSLYITTGNNYTVPADVSACVAAAADPADKERCLDPKDHFDSIVALDLCSGGLRWSRRALPFDAWVVSCLPPFASAGNCPDPAGPDYDFGQGPALFTIKQPGKRHREVLGAGQKSGQYWVVDPDDGSLVWVTQTGPGGAAGGLQWGSATDGMRIFTANANSDHKAWSLVQNGVDSGVSVNGGLWSALDAVTGRILWQVANPSPDPLLASTGVTAGSNAPVTLANGVVYGCSLDSEGHMFAMDAVSGRVLWEFSSSDSGSCGAGPAIVNGMVYWGSGYAGPVGISGKNKMRAFRLP
jgi:polyvinyl alcohol dehydrogenase (cytochrome)